MKLINVPRSNEIILEVETTGENIKSFGFPKHDIHYWYPFNINFFYKYTDAKNYLYLVKDKSYEGPNFYNVDILKRTKPLGTKNGVMFRPEVYKRNKYIISRARQLGIPTINSSYTQEELQKGFQTLSDAISMVKWRAEERCIRDLGKDFYTPPILSEEWDNVIYNNYMTEKESAYLIELGEIYTMLNVMRKLIENY